MLYYHKKFYVSVPVLKSPNYDQVQIKESSNMLIMYLGTSPILALKSHILSEVHFIGKTGGAEIATCPCAHSWCAVELAFTPLWVQPQGLRT